MSDWRIPFNRPSLVGREMEYVADVFHRGHAAGDGLYTAKCSALLEKLLGARKVLLTTSCTHALELAALLLNIQSGDEVILPAFTFVSTVNAFVLRGARPVFVDIRPDTLNLDEALLPQAITPHTRTIVPVHYAGVGCDMEAISETADRYGLSIVEDNAHGLFGQYHGQYLGTFGSLAAQSFHETKNFSCGEGGALLINDEQYIERAEILREKGTNRSRFFRGQVDKYTWVDVGSSYLPSEILAAFLFAQLEAHQTIQARRERIWHCYWTNLEDWASRRGVGLPVVPPDRDQAFHMFYLILPSIELRQRLIQHLKANGILSVFQYLPLHLSEMGRRLGGQPGDCPVTEDISDRLLRLPFYNDFSESDQAVVIETILSFE